MYIPPIRSILNRIQHFGEVTSDLQVVIDKNIKRVNEVMLLKKAHKTFDISVTGNKISLLETNISFISEDLSDLLKNSNSATVVAMTLGRRIDEESLRLQRLDTLDAIVFDAIASEVIELIAEELNEEITQQARENKLYTTRRYSPGYGDLELSAQEDIIDIFTRYHLGINLTKSNMLTPAKSITAIIGLSKIEEENTMDFCLNCKIREKCKKRNTGDRCGHKE